MHKKILDLKIVEGEMKFVRRFKYAGNKQRLIYLPKEVELFGINTEKVLITIQPKKIIIEPFEEKEKG